MARSTRAARRRSRSAPSSTPRRTDTTAGFHYAYSCSNASLAGATYASTTGASEHDLHLSATTATYTVRARIIDKDDGFTEYTTTVIVNNVAPTATLTNNGPVNEGSPATITLQRPVRPRVDRHGGRLPLRLQLHQRLPGRRDLRQHRRASRARPAPIRDNGTYTVRARIIDKDDGFTEYTTTVIVNNVAPTATLANNGPVNEGSPATITFSGQFDPRVGPTRRPASTTPTAAPTPPGRRDLRQHHRRPATHDLHLPDNGDLHRPRPDHRQGRRLHRVHHDGHRQQRRPDRDPGQRWPGQRGAARRRSRSAVSSTHRRTDTTAGFHYAYSCSNASLAGATYASTGGPAPRPAAPISDNGTYTVRARIIDKDDGFTEYTTTVTVNNVNPTATLANNGPVNEASPATISFSGQFDPIVGPTRRPASTTPTAAPTPAWPARPTPTRRPTAPRPDLHLQRQRDLHRRRSDHRQGRRLHRVHHDGHRQQRRTRRSRCLSYPPTMPSPTTPRRPSSGRTPPISRCIRHDHVHVPGR